MESQMGQHLVMRTPGWVIVVVTSLMRRVRRVSHGRLDDLTAKGCNQLKSIQGWTRHGSWAISLCIVLEMRRTLKGDVIGSLVNHASYDKMCMGMALSVVDLMASWTSRPNAFPSMGPSSADRQFLFVRLHIREAGDESGRNTLTTINRDAVTYWSMWAPPCLASSKPGKVEGDRYVGCRKSASDRELSASSTLIELFAHSTHPRTYSLPVAPGKQGRRKKRAVKKRTERCRAQLGRRGPASSAYWWSSPSPQRSASPAPHSTGGSRRASPPPNPFLLLLIPDARLASVIARLPYPSTPLPRVIFLSSSPSCFSLESCTFLAVTMNF
ncbi:hypothetical protein BHM03_00036591 [Ensete ventricosum]|nr:hypothetical protein BHM03_00036591 [Ensete ventricosum]